MLAVLAIGLILDRLTPPGQAYGREAFAWAMSVQFVLWTIGAVQVARCRHARAAGSRPRRRKPTSVSATTT
ncbi:MAG: hypothetical protein R2742_11925 [Micropruina glycogenica]